MDLYIDGVNYGDTTGYTNQSSNFDELPFPSDPTPSYLPKGLGGSQSAVTNPPPVSTLQHIWDVIKQDTSIAIDDTEGAVKSVYSGTKGVISTVYGDVSSGVGTVVGDVTAPIGNTLKTTYLYLLLGLVVVGGIIYFAGKGGAVRLSR